MIIITPLFVVLNIVVFFLVWLFVKTIDTRKWLTILVSLVITPVIYFYIFYPLVNIFITYHHQKYFNQESWQTKSSLRYEMSDYIINENIFLGKTKKEIENILGKPEWYSWSDSLKEHDKNNWNYNLGFKPGAFNNKQECLELIFKADTVAFCRQYQIEKNYKK